MNFCDFDFLGVGLGVSYEGVVLECVVVDVDFDGVGVVLDVVDVCFGLECGL